VADKTENDNALGVDEKHHLRLNDIESLALTTNMANSVTNSIQTFYGYDSHDPKLWFTKLEAYFRARRMQEDTWLAAINGFLSGEVLYAIEDIPADDRDSYQKLKVKISSYYKLTPIAKINLLAELAKRFQLPGEPAETFINDVVKKSKRLEFKTDTILKHLKRGFRGEIQRYLSLKPPANGDLAALIQTAREADSMTPEPLDTAGITSQLKQMQEQIAKIIVGPGINSADHENTNYNIPLPPPPPPRIIYRDAPPYEYRQDNYRGTYNNNPRGSNRGYGNNNRGGYSNSTRGGYGNSRGGYRSDTPALGYRNDANGGYRGDRGGYRVAPRGSITDARYFSRGGRGAYGGQTRPNLALMPTMSNPNTTPCRECAGSVSHGTANECPAMILTCYRCGQFGHVAPACTNK
jgi:hypothetical protein